MTAEPLLVVDDNPINLKLVRVLLGAEGYDVRAAHDADEALDVLKTFKPRLIMMDLQLPGMDGYALTRLLKADPRLCDVVIIAITSYAMKGDEQKALDAGCDAYVTKPLDTTTFPVLIAHHLGLA